MQTSQADIFKTKQHFETLDGLRGVAALAIIVFHFSEFIYSEYSKNFIGHGFLAVDFFYCLSGFVIAYSYDDRIGKIGKWEFLKSRLIRLHPLVILGSVFGLICFLFDPFNTHAIAYGAGKIFVIFISSIFLVPYPVMPERGMALFGLNSPSWSLFFEYAANLAYALVLYKVGKKYLLLLVLLAAIAICIVGYRSTTLIGGWDEKTFLDGCVRITYSFLAGLLIYRRQWIINSKLGFVSLSILLLCPFFMPYFKWNWLAEPMVVIFYFPLIIAIGAGATISDKYQRICTFLGNISYPLYMCHIGFLFSFGNYYYRYKPTAYKLSLIISIGTLLLALLAYLIFILFDVPVRKYLWKIRRRGKHNTTTV